MKFTERGDIVIHTSCVSVADKTVLRFAVRDSGIGISDEQMGRLFQAFSQADDSTTRKFGGTGLGLAISRQLVELMDGRIWAESEPGKGSTFFFEIPFGITEDVAQRESSSVSELVGTRVLVVDDNANAREILRSHLELFKLRVEAVDSAEAAFERLVEASEDPFRLVLMDYRMPGLDGISAATRIRHELKLSVTPKLILVTAATRLASDELQSNQDVDEVLSKPINASLLFDTIASLFGATVLTNRSRLQDRSAAFFPDLRSIQGARILIVEDNAINRQVATELLEQSAFVVESVTNGQEAVDRLQQADFDCVLMDIQMPVMDGYEAVRRLVAAGERVPIIALTAHAMPGDREKCVEAGCHDYLCKPVDARALIAAIRHAIAPGATECTVMRRPETFTGEFPGGPAPRAAAG
jgi:CheY-like chemotaxis protein